MRKQVVGFIRGTFESIGESLVHRIALVHFGGRGRPTTVNFTSYIVHLWEENNKGAYLRLTLYTCGRKIIRVLTLLAPYIVHLWEENYKGAYLRLTLYTCGRKFITVFSCALSNILRSPCALKCTVAYSSAPTLRQLFVSYDTKSI